MDNYYKVFFRETGDYSIQVQFYDCVRHFTVEEMYQHFKARLIDELEVKNNDIGYGLIRSELVSKD